MLDVGRFAVRLQRPGGADGRTPETRVKIQRRGHGIRVPSPNPGLAGEGSVGEKDREDLTPAFQTADN